MLRLFDIKATCPICNKPEECLIAEDGSACICYHVAEGSVKRCGNAGWLHILKPGQFVPQKHTPKPKPYVNWALKNRIFQRNFNREVLPGLGLTAPTLECFGGGYDGDMWTFPMYNEIKEVIGIQQRTHNGKKYTMEHGDVGVFAPNSLNQQTVRHQILLVCEGMSDAATAFELGWPSIGKYNYSAGNEIVFALCKKWRSLTSVIVVADPDQDGIWGAELLQDMLRRLPMGVSMLTPPEDLRTMYTKGLTADQFSDKISESLKRE